MHDQHGRNYSFFDAPVGLIFTIDRVMQQGSWLDFGMFLADSVRTGRDQDHDSSLAHREFGGINALGGLPQVVVGGIGLGHHDVGEARLRDSVDGL